ncbi:GL19355 [Drosophila persimilis]|uniref:GL19355 n=1 Tax=Drosophila persimilis TaxID=7234 RepID=B4G8V2_DROPE|nr:GL19355 [Drosophila persimilis]
MSMSPPTDARRGWRMASPVGSTFKSKAASAAASASVAAIMQREPKRRAPTGNYHELELHLETAKARATEGKSRQPEKERAKDLNQTCDCFLRVRR